MAIYRGRRGDGRGQLRRQRRRALGRRHGRDGNRWFLALEFDGADGALALWLLLHSSWRTSCTRTHARPHTHDHNRTA